MGEADVAIFAYIFDELQTPLLGSVNTLVGVLIAWVKTPMRVALVLYVAGIGFAMMRGQAGNSGNMTKHLVTLSLVAWFCTDAAAYKYWVSDTFMVVLPTELARVIASASGNSAPLGANSFDAVLRQSFDAGMSLVRLLGWRDVLPAIFVLIFWIVAALACAVGFGIWSLSYVIGALFVDIGPLLIPLALFAFTRSVFERWIGALIQCAILQVFVLILLVVVMLVEGALLAKVALYTGSNPYALIFTLLAAVIFFGFATFIAWRLPALAASLAGGLHFNVEGAARSVFSSTMNVGRSAVQGVRSLDGNRPTNPPAPPTPPIPPTAGASLSRSARPGPTLTRATP